MASASANASRQGRSGVNPASADFTGDNAEAGLTPLRPWRDALAEALATLAG